MKNFFRLPSVKSLLAVALIAGTLLGSFAASQAIVLWSSSKGDVNLPGIEPGAIDGVVIGGTTPAAGSFTALNSATATNAGLGTTGSLKVDTGTKTASATAGAATLAKNAGVITSEALSTAAGALYTLTITNSTVAAADQVMASVSNGTNSAGTPSITTVTAGSNSVIVIVKNIHATDAFNGTIKVAFVNHKN